MMKKIWIMVVFAFMSESAYSTEYLHAKISEILVGPSYGNKVILKIVSDEVHSLLPGCQDNQNFNAAFDGTSETGKMYLSIALSAYSMQKEIYAQTTTNGCNVYFDIEDLRSITLQ